MVVNRRPAVLYHYPCPETPDGPFAALAAHLYFSAVSAEPLFFPNTVYSPITPQHFPLPNIDHLYLLDFVGPPGFVQKISSMVPNVVVLDHHKSAIGTPIGGNVAGVVDMNRCGATIAFEYIEDGDLWTWKLPNSKAFSSGLKDLNLQYDVGLNPSLFQYVISSLLASLIDGVEITEKLCALLIFGLNEHLLSLDLESLISEGMASYRKSRN